MKRCYIPSNKQNENIPLQNQQPSIQRPKFQRYPSSKSPLRQDENGKHPNKYKPSTTINTKSPFKINYTQMIDQSNVIPVRVSYKDRIRNRKSDQKEEIRPISMVQDNNVKLFHDEVKQVYNPVSITKTRQNAKKIQFSAKVNNLQKISNQIFSLLSYVDQNRPTKKDLSLSQKPEQSKIKPRYENYTQSKQYQRRISTLEQPKQHEPLISGFNINENQQSSINVKIEHQLKPTQQIRRYEYSNNQLLNKSKIKQQPKSPKFNNIKDKNQNLIQQNHSKQKLKPNISQNMTRTSKITQSNPDLQNFYDSLKKRENQIKHFQMKLYQNQNITNQRSKSRKKLQLQISIDSKADQFMQPIQRQSVRDRLNRKDKSQILKQSHTLITRPQRPQHKFITQDEIEVYKDMRKANINRIKQINEITQKQFQQKVVSRSTTPKTKTYQSNSKRFLQIQLQESSILGGHYIQSTKLIKQDMDKGLTSNMYNSKQKLINQKQRQIDYLKIRSTYNKRQNFIDNQKQTLIKNKKQTLTDNQKKTLTDNQKQALIDNKNQTLIDNQTTKIDQKIKKIKNQLKQCQQEKFYLREKYQNLLEDDKQRKNLRQNQYLNHLNINKPLKQYPNQININRAQNQYLNHSNISKPLNQHLNHSNINQPSTQQSYRKNIIRSQSQRFYEDDKYNKRQYQQPFKQLRINLDQSSQTIKQPFFKRQTAQPIRNLSKTPKKASEFKIQLCKVQITKPQTTRLGTILSKKIQIDLRLRQQRQKFMKLHSQQKWQQLSSYLISKKHLCISALQCQTLLTLTSQQHDPFSASCFQPQTPKSSQQCIILLSQYLQESIKFYEQQIRNKFDRIQLEREGFKLDAIDLSGKGYLSVQDFVCFVNLHDGKFYRNRDLVFNFKYMLLNQLINDRFRIQYHQMYQALTNSYNTSNN